MALKSDAAADKSKDQLSRDFPGRSIFDFCNNIGTFETCRPLLTMSVVGGRAEVPQHMAKTTLLTRTGNTVSLGNCPPMDRKFPRSLIAGLSFRQRRLANIPEIAHVRFHAFPDDIARLQARAQLLAVVRTSLDDGDH